METLKLDHADTGVVTLTLDRPHKKNAINSTMWKELALLAEVISAQEAERIGIVNRVVPTEDLDAFVDDWAVRLAQGAPLALKMTKCMLTDALSYSLNEALDAEAMAQTVNFGADDAREASGLSGQARAGLSGALSGSRDRWHAALIFAGRP